MWGDCSCCGRWDWQHVQGETVVSMLDPQMWEGYPGTEIRAGLLAGEVTAFICRTCGAMGFSVTEIDLDHGSEGKCPGGHAAAGAAARGTRRGMHRGGKK